MLLYGAFHPISDHPFLQHKQTPLKFKKQAQKTHNFHIIDPRVEEIFQLAKLKVGFLFSTGPVLCDVHRKPKIKIPFSFFSWRIFRRRQSERNITTGDAKNSRFLKGSRFSEVIVPQNRIVFTSTEYCRNNTRHQTITRVFLLPSLREPNSSCFCNVASK